MATVTQPPVTRTPPREKRNPMPANERIDKPVKRPTPTPTPTVDSGPEMMEISRKDRWTSIAILVAILALMGLLLFLAGLQTPSTPAPPHWTDWPMM